MNMSEDFVDQLNRLHKLKPPIEEVYNAIEKLQDGLGDDKGVVWAYYYPVALRQAHTFFNGDEEVANQAAFELIEHLLEHALHSYSGERGMLSSFYNRVSVNFFINFLKQVLRSPILILGYEEESSFDDDGDEAELNHLRQPTPHNLKNLEDYPYDGIEPNFVEKLMDRQEAAEIIGTLREDLYPADQEVLDLLVSGYTSFEMADVLGRSTKAVAMSIERIREMTKSI